MYRWVALVGLMQAVACGSSGPSPCGDDCVDTARFAGRYAMAQVLTIDVVLESAQADVPVAVTFDPSTYPELTFAPVGDDVRFADASGTELAFERETWSPTDATFWVKLPRIAADTPTRFVMLAGGAGEPAVATADVWANAFAGVWHFAGEPSAGSVPDATGRAAAALVGTTVPVRGAFGGAVRFSGTAHARVAGGGATGYLALPPDGMSLEAIVRRDDGATSGTQTIVNRQRGASYLDAYSLGVAAETGPRDVAVFVCGAEAYSQDQAAVPRNTWLHLLASREGDDMVLYTNGVETGRATVSSANAADDNDVIFAGAENSASAIVDEGWVGDIDEIRLASAPRDASWARLHYRMMVGTLVTFGAVQQP